MKHYCLFVILCITIIGMSEGGRRPTNHCYWDGTAPACRGECYGGYKTCKRDNIWSCEMQTD
uniref:Uncharacterized protein n=1 Tax=Strigamia maritima TaxID=126957 RepID=T1IUD7_STRMM